MLGFGAVGRIALGQISTSHVTTLSAATGAFLLSGQAAIFRISQVSGLGTFLLSGQSAPLTVNIVASPGAYNLTGIDIRFKYTDRRPLYQRGTTTRAPKYWRGST
jgi:hypothetical protein